MSAWRGIDLTGVSANTIRRARIGITWGHLSEKAS